jgi:imidazolonepropionase-like amidohydrolase
MLHGTIWLTVTIRGAYVMPGGVDAHVHLCQDLKTGLYNRGDLYTLVC